MCGPPGETGTWRYQGRTFLRKFFFALLSGSYEYKQRGRANCEFFALVSLKQYSAHYGDGVTVFKESCSVANVVAC